MVACSAWGEASFQQQEECWALVLGCLEVMSGCLEALEAVQEIMERAFQQLKLHGFVILEEHLDGRRGASMQLHYI